MELPTFNTIDNAIGRADPDLIGEFHGSGIAHEVVKEDTRVLCGKEFRQSMLDLASRPCMDGQNIIKVNNEE